MIPIEHANRTRRGPGRRHRGSLGRRSTGASTSAFTGATAGMQRRPWSLH